MELSRGKGVTLWKQIADILSAEINREVFPPGQRLPSEHDLAGRFTVNRHTIRRALADLEDKSIIRVEHGSGAFVQEKTVEYKVSRRTRFSRNLADQKMTAGNIVLDAGEIAAPMEAAQALELGTGTKLYYIESCGTADDRIIVTGTNFFPKDRFQGIIESFKESKSITSALRECGIADYFRKTTRVASRMPSAKIARQLHIPKSQPVLKVTAVNMDTAGRPIQYGVHYYHGDLVELVFDP